MNVKRDLELMPIEIRKANAADAEALAACIDAAYAKYASRISDLPPVSSGISEEIEQSQVWVATESGEVIAGLFLSAHEGVLKLANIAVHPEHGGKGLGRALMERAENEAKRQGMSEMHLSTHVDMPENVRLYQYLGWQEYERNGNRVSMRKNLGSAKKTV
ncbi:MAG: N-acetylglutamate synthase-like GNAT family acetyltransferase [Pseudophaeobacter arcticus]